jgi:hypothetical protein
MHRVISGFTFPRQNGCAIPSAHAAGRVDAMIAPAAIQAGKIA